MTFRTLIVRGRLAALITCTLITTLLPLSATAEYGIPAGSGAVITAGGPLLVRVAPGWDAEVSYEIADGSAVTVYDAAQTAPDGSLWYAVDGGFVPVDGVTSVATLDGAAAPDATTQDLSAPVASDDWVDPAATQGWVDPNTGQWVDPATQGWVDPNTGQWVDPNTGEWVDPAATRGWIDPNTGEWVEPAATTADGSFAYYQEAAPDQWVDPATVAPDAAAVQSAPSEGWVDPATGQWVQPTPDGWVDPATGQWVAPSGGGWVDPATGQWVQETADGWVDPATGQWVADPAAAPQDGVALYQEAAADDASPDEWVEPADPTAGQELSVPTADPSAEPIADETSGEWVEPTIPTDVNGEPATDDEWVEPAPVDAAPVDDGGSGVDAWGEPIATAYISGTSGDGAACRASAQRGSEKLAVLGEGEAVEVRGEAIGEWQPVNCAGVGGYVNTSLISWDPAPTDTTDTSDASIEDVSGKRGRRGGGGSGSGQSMANFAMQYVGYPYVYAGEGPYAFDCSGFTKFVAQNALGINITHDMFTQIGMGQSVGMDELQPGDLVFFQNTFRPGLSHVGVYVGNGQFVHAENESTGVMVSDLNSDYYGSRWAGGTRLAS